MGIECSRRNFMGENQRMKGKKKKEKRNDKPQNANANTTLILMDAMKIGIGMKVQQFAAEEVWDERINDETKQNE